MTYEEFKIFLYETFRDLFGHDFIMMLTANGVDMIKRLGESEVHHFNISETSMGGGVFITGYHIQYIDPNLYVRHFETTTGGLLRPR